MWVYEVDYKPTFTKVDYTKLRESVAKSVEIYEKTAQNKKF